MTKLILKTAEVFRSKDAVTAIEYGLIAALVAVAIIAALTGLTNALNGTYETVSGHLGASPN